MYEMDHYYYIKVTASALVSDIPEPGSRTYPGPRTVSGAVWPSRTHNSSRTCTHVDRGAGLLVDRRVRVVISRAASSVHMWGSGSPLKMRWLSEEPELTLMRKALDVAVGGSCAIQCTLHQDDSTFSTAREHGHGLRRSY